MAKNDLINLSTMHTQRTFINSNFTEIYNNVFPITSVSVDTVLNGTHCTVKVNATSGNKIITLPTAVGIAGKSYRIQKSDSSNNTITIACNGAQTINDSATVTIQYKNTCLNIQSDGANWIII